MLSRRHHRNLCVRADVAVGGVECLAGVRSSSADSVAPHPPVGFIGGSRHRPTHRVQFASMTDPTPLTPAQLRCLADWLPILEAPDFSTGRWRGGESDEPGVVHMPWFDYDARILGWPGMCEGGSLIVMGFDWMTWLRTPEGVALSSASAAIARASSTDLARLVTAIVRGDRFAEGNLASAIASGVVMAICRRAAALLDQAT